MRKSIWISLALTATLFANERGSVFEGPEGVSNQLVRPQEKTDEPSAMHSYRQWKKELAEDYDLSYGLQAIMLYQKAQDVLPSKEDDGAGAIYRFFGKYTAFKEDNGHTGRIVWRVENRSNIGSLQSPSELSGAIGMAGLNSGFAYSSNFDTDISVLHWEQGVEGEFGYAIGRLAFDAYLDAYAFQTFSRAFINRSFVVNPTLATTGIGALGVAAKGFVTDNILVGLQIYDANAVSGKFDIDTIKESEFLKAVEVAWSPSKEQYKLSKVQLTYWQKDAREKAGIKKGSGWALSATHQINDFLPFFRFGHSDGGAGVAAKNAASTGFEYNLVEDQYLSFGAGWAEDSVFENNEYVIESSYRMDFSPHVSIMPDLQLLLNPTNNPSVDSDFVVGFRVVLNL